MITHFKISRKLPDENGAEIRVLLSAHKYLQSYCQRPNPSSFKETGVFQFMLFLINIDFNPFLKYYFDSKSVIEND